MRLEFTDRRGVNGVVHGDPWGLEYDGMYEEQLMEAVTIYEEVDVRVPVEDDDLPPEVKINAHQDEAADLDTRLRFLRRRWVQSPYIIDMELILDDEHEHES